mgnify:CR=1 FL=1
MSNENLQEYIRKSRESGADDESIKNELRRAGWQEGDIIQAFGGHQTASGTYVTSHKSRRLAIFFLIGPIVGLALIFFTYAIAIFAVRSLVNVETPSDYNYNINYENKRTNINRSLEDRINEGLNYGGTAVDHSDPRQAIFLIINIILGFLAILCIIGIIIGVILAIVLFNKKELVSGAYDERSGRGKDSIIPPEIKGWNWGAFGVTLIWGIYYGAWAVLWGFLLGLIPIIGILWWVYVGIKGNEWAWRKNKWQSVEQFITAQNKWKPWGIAFFIFSILSMIPLLIQILNRLKV